MSNQRWVPRSSAQSCAQKILVDREDKSKRRRQSSQALKPGRFVFLTALGLLSLLLATTFIAEGQLVTRKVVTARPLEASDKPSESDNSKKAGAALIKADALIQGNRMDQAALALGGAIALFKQIGDAKGEAAAHNSLGDVLARSGQDGDALLAYQNAERLFRTQQEKIDANLVLAKIGSVYRSLGKEQEARAAYAGIDMPFSSARTSPFAAALNSSNQNTAPGQVNKPALSPDERRAFDGVNAERLKHNLNALTWDDSLALLARRQSEYMANGGTPGHRDGNGLELGGRAAALGITGYDEIAENLAYSEGYDDPVAFAVERWMTETIHKKNALNEHYTLGGIGVAKSPGGASFFSQIFIALRAGQGEDDLYRKFICYATGEFGLGRTEYEAGRFDEANRHFKNVLAAADPSSVIGKLAHTRRFRAAALTSLADVAYRQKDYPAALGLYAQSIAGAVQDQRTELTWAAQSGTARTKWAQAALGTDAQVAAALRTEALASYQESIATIETHFLLSSIRSEEARQSFLSTTGSVFDDASASLAEMSLLLSSTQPQGASKLNASELAHAAEGQRIIEAGRARKLLDQLADAKAELTEGLPIVPLQRRSEVQARQNEITKRISGVNLDGALPLSEAATLEKEFDNLEQELVGLETQLRAANPRYAALTKPRALTLDEVQQKILDEQTVLLQYSLGQDASYLWAVSRSEGVMMVRLPARSVLESKVMEFRSKLLPASLRRSLINTEDAQAQKTRGLGLETTASPASANTSANTSAFQTSAYDLYRVLLEPVAPLIRGKRLLIVADGPLHFIPFEALVTSLDGDGYQNFSYLLKSYEIAYAPSVSVLSGEREKASPSSIRGPVLVLADPVFDGLDPRAIRGGAALKQQVAAKPNLKLRSAIEDDLQTLTRGVKLPRLKGTRDEAEQIMALTSSSGNSGVTMLDEEASETGFGKRDLSRFRIVHLATHGLLNTERPQFTGLVLSLVGDEDNDGFLLVDEIFNLRLKARLVMLSACETGLGKLKHGESMSGLTRAFMYSGASTVGVSLWPISDAATASLMTGFYKRLMTGEGPPPLAAAMRGAQLEMIAGGRYSAPFYWAPFILVGEYQ